MDIENFLASAHPYSKTSKRTYRDVIPKILKDLHIPSLTARELIEAIENIKTWGNARQLVALHACKAYIAWAHGRTHPALSAKIKRISGKVPRAISAEQAKLLLASFNPWEAKGARDLAIASLLLDTGLREAEIVNTLQAYVDTEHLNLQVVVKGGEWEFAIFTPETAAHIEQWKAFRKRLNPDPTLFVHCKTGKAITPQGLYTIVREWGKKLGFALGVHDFRRGFATIASENGAPDRLIMEGGRWKSTSMVTKYTKTIKLKAMRPYLPTSKL